MRLAFAEAETAYRMRFLGREMSVLWESVSSLGPDGWEMSGLTDNYLRVTTITPQPLWNQIAAVKLVALAADGLLGEMTG